MGEREGEGEEDERAEWSGTEREGEGTEGGGMCQSIHRIEHSHQQPGLHPKGEGEAGSSSLIIILTDIHTGSVG